MILEEYNPLLSGSRSSDPPITIGYYTGFLGLSVVVFPFFITTSIAFSIMNTNNVSAVWASMRLFLVFQKGTHAFSVYHFEVFNHAHAIAFAVTLV